MSIYYEKSADKVELVATIATKRGARTITIEEKTYLIYTGSRV